MTASLELVAQHYIDLARAGGAVTADECFGTQLALPPQSPDLAYEAIYSMAITTMAEMVRAITKKRQVNSPALDSRLTSLALEAFDQRWTDLNARLSAGGEA
ncbi:MAG: hypothetical protein ACOH2N_06980 [Devosia sp.]